MAGAAAPGAPRHAMLASESDAKPEANEPDPTANLPAVVETPHEVVRRFAAEHVRAISLVLVVAVVFGAYHVLSARGEHVPAPTPSVAVSPTPESIIVHVVGAVHTPGIVTLPEGARVVDAIDAAGGVCPEADLDTLNLAQRLNDGVQIVVGTGEQSSELRGSEGASGGGVSLNQASAAQLEELPGVGPVTAQAIVDWREANGGFTSVEQLQEVDGIGPKTFAKLRDSVSV